MKEEMNYIEERRGGDGMPELLTVREAYGKLRISKWMLYRLIRSGKLVSIRIGRRRLIPARAVSELVEQLSRESMV
ncbi:MULTISPECIES: helix-turn-helix domain-containing protein [unclassified Streptomyces]|uniref:Helix-turn-helix domain-containing protein n=1 Tax=Streptomyces sp. NBC_00060 TaxID=2975636 RepID=A0AAU2GY01_9ACTN